MHAAGHANVGNSLSCRQICSISSRSCVRVARQSIRQQHSVQAVAVTATPAIASVESQAYPQRPPFKHQHQQQVLLVANTCNVSAAGSRGSGTGRRSLQDLSLRELLDRLRERQAAAASDPALLTAAIKACSSMHEAAAVFFEYSSAFNHIHTAAWISHLPKVLRPAQLQQLSPADQCDLSALLVDVAQLAEEVLPQCRGRELANIAHGFAALGFYSRRLMQLLLCRCQLSSLRPQELSNLTWAVAKLQHDVHEGWVSEVLWLSQEFMARGQLKPQEMCNIAWGLAVMQRRCMLAASPPLRHVCTRVDDSWKAEFCQAVEQQLALCSAADVAMALWALAVLGYSRVQQRWLDRVLGRAQELLQAEPRQGGMQGRHAANVLWAVHQLLQQQQQQGQGQPQQLLSHWQAASSAAPGSSRLFITADKGVDSTGGLHCSSSSSSLHQFWCACQPKLQQLLLLQPDSWQPQQLRCSLVMLLGLSRLEIQPPVKTVKVLVGPAAVQLQAFADCKAEAFRKAAAAAAAESGVGVTAFLSASDGVVAKHQLVLQQLLDSTSTRRVYSRQQQHHQQQLRLVDVTLLLYSLVRLSYRPGRATLAAAVRAAGVCCWELLQQRQWQQRQQQQRQQQRSQVQPAAAPVTIRGQELALLLWCLVRLRCRPRQPLLQLVAHTAALQIETFHCSELALLFWGLARRRHMCSFEQWIVPMVQHLLARVDDCVVAGPAISLVVYSLPLLPPSRKMRQNLKQQLGFMLPQLAAAAQQRFGECNQRELVQLLLGFARLGFRPNAGWMAAHRARVMELGLERFNSRDRQVMGACVGRLLALTSPDPCYECAVDSRYHHQQQQQKQQSWQPRQQQKQQSWQPRQQQQQQQKQQSWQPRQQQQQQQGDSKAPAAAAATSTIH